LGGRNREDQEAKRRRILKVAAREFVSKGYNGANINVIAEKSGIGKGTIYLYFPSKAELFTEALRESNKLWLERAREVVSSETDPLAALRKLLRLDVVLGVEHKELAQLWLSSFFGENRQFAGTAAEVFEEYLRLVLELVRKCVDNGTFRKVDERLASYTLLGLNELIIAFYDQLLRDWGDAGEVHEAVLDMILEGMKVGKEERKSRAKGR